MLTRFYVVTLTSLYKVHSGKQAKPPVAVKIALRGESKCPVGGRINNGPLMAVGRWLQAYIPEGHSWLSPCTSYVREIGEVNTMWWRGGTSEIVALFTSKAKALRCFEQRGLKSCDPRWHEETMKVVKLIGDKHPKFTVSHTSSCALPIVLETCVTANQPA